MKRLEDFIAANRNEFEDGKPGMHHEEKFLQMLNEQSRQKTSGQFSRINTWLKAAAAVLILAGFGFAILTLVRNPNNNVQQTEVQLPEEITEMDQYYTTLTKEKLSQVESLAGQGPEAEKVKTMLKSEIEHLNKTSDELKSEYLKGTRDERLVNAIRNNYRILSGLLDKVVEQLSQPVSDSSEPVNSSESSSFNSNIKRHENIFS